MKQDETENYLDEVFEALSSAERRNILVYLQEEQYSRVEELIDFLEDKENVRSKNWEIGLKNIHLPKLRDKGWIDYDTRPDEFKDSDISLQLNEEDSKDSIISDYLRQSLEDEEEDLDELFSVLKNSERRNMVYLLRKEENKSNLTQIATDLAALNSDQNILGEDYDPTEKEVNKQKINMVHQNIPMLEEAGIVEYDRNSEKLSLTEEYTDEDNLIIKYLERFYEE